jgi:hypothetical protein
MADAAPATTTDPAGLGRTPDGSLANPSIAPSTSAETTTPTTQPTPDGNTLLTQEQPNAPAKTEPTKADDAKDAKAPAAAPEKYEDYKVPEGFDLDPAVKAEADAIFKGMNLSQAQAQTLVDFYTAKTLESSQQPYQAWKAMTDTWRDEAANHPDLKGKLGPGQEVNLRIARALESLGDRQLTNDFRALMDLTGAGNNQAFIRVINALASRAVEGTAVNGRGPAEVAVPGAATRPSPAQALYPHLPSANR